MPELPEVETIRRGLERHLAGARILSVASGTAPLRKTSPRPLSEMSGASIQRLRRHGKVLFADLSGARTLVMHLGMSGKLLLAGSEEPVRPHTHVRVRLDGAGVDELRFVDPRRFGWFSLHGPHEEPDDVAHYGPDAFDARLDRTWTKALAGSRAPLKAFLLDQTKIAGVGNIYACEAMWRARLAPARRACDVTSRRAGELLLHVRDVLEQAIAQGGTSFNDYVDAIGRRGSFLSAMAVFQREGLPCPRCSRPVRRMAQGGRSTFWCPRCQR